MLNSAELPNVIDTSIHTPIVTAEPHSDNKQHTSSLKTIAYNENTNPSCSRLLSQHRVGRLSTRNVKEDSTALHTWQWLGISLQLLLFPSTKGKHSYQHIHKDRLGMCEIVFTSNVSKFNLRQGRYNNKPCCDVQGV